MHRRGTRAQEVVAASIWRFGAPPELEIVVILDARDRIPQNATAG